MKNTLLCISLIITLQACSSNKPTKGEYLAKKALFSKRKQFKACFAKYTPHFQNSTQKISFKMLIDDRGRARRLHFDQQMPRRVRDCLVAIMSRISFPPPDKGQVREIREEFIFTRKVRRK
ncbi:MAG: hypothetical protein HN509_17345 [Halobacteriovoraceae bacterium]|jgi:hypothetical protein|nr:hypothetical protein [Halobacteriovoraceae bacterium]MBT5094538.1 hypothetical protein [Halobacteriovoraceae bacterium]